MARILIGTAVMLVSAGFAWAQPATIPSAAPPAGASSCSGCHPAGGVETSVPRLQGRKAAEVVEMMQAFRSGQRPSTVMDRIAKGFSDAETQAMVQAEFVRVTGDFDGAIAAVPTADLKAVKITHGKKELGLTRADNGDWSFAAPVNYGLADVAGDPQPKPEVFTGVRPLLMFLTGLSAGGPESFVESPGPLDKYGLNPDSPDLTRIELVPKSGKSEVLLVGKKVDGKEHRYVRRAVDGKDQAYVFTVSDWDLRDFQNDPAQFLEKKPDDTKPEGTEPAMGEVPAMEPAMEGTTEPAMSEPGTPPPAMDEPGMQGMEEPAPPPPPAMDDAPKEAGGR